MKKNLTSRGFYSLLSAMLLLLGSCNQASFDDPRSSYDGSRGGHPGTLRSPHPVRFSLEAAFDSGMDEPQQSGRILEFGDATKDTIVEVRREILEEEMWANFDKYKGTLLDDTPVPYGDGYVSLKMDQESKNTSGLYPLLLGKLDYQPTHAPVTYDPTYFGGSSGGTARGIMTHTFIYGYDEQSQSYDLKGYAKLSWGIYRQRSEATAQSSGGTESEHNRWARKEAYGQSRVLLKAEQEVDVYQASYSSDRSRIVISEDQFFQLEQGRKYRILAINDDGGFDPERPSLEDYPEGAAPMFYFAKGGNSPLPAAVAFGNEFPNNSGVIAYGLELDYVAPEYDIVKVSSGSGAEFYPLSPLLKLYVGGEVMQYTRVKGNHQLNFNGMHEYRAAGAPGLEYVTDEPTETPYVLASSCLTQNFAYTITGVNEVGAKPSFKTILRTLQAEAYDWVGSPLEGTTYEPLLIPPFPGVTRKVCYLPLEPRYAELSSLDQQATFVVPSTGEKIQGALLADGDLYFRFYLKEDGSKKLYEHPYSVDAQPRLLDYFRAMIDDGFSDPRTYRTQLRYGFNLALARGGTVRDKAEAVELFWRNSREKRRYNMNRLSVPGVQVLSPMLRRAKDFLAPDDGASNQL